MVSYFVSEQPTVERSLVAGPPGHRATLSSLSLTYNVRPVGNVANVCQILSTTYVFHLAISIVVVLVHDCLSLLVVTLKLHNSYICNLD